MSELVKYKKDTLEGKDVYKFELEHIIFYTSSLPCQGDIIISSDKLYEAIIYATNHTQRYLLITVCKTDNEVVVGDSPMNDVSYKEIQERIKYIGDMSYIEVNMYEIYDWGGICKCDNCNRDIVDKGYLIFLLNSCICEECFSNIVRRYRDINLSHDDKSIQSYLHSDFYKNYLNRRNYEDTVNYINFINKLSKENENGED